MLDALMMIVRASEIYKLFAGIGWYLVVYERKLSEISAKAFLLEFCGWNNDVINILRSNKNLVERKVELFRKFAVIWWLKLEGKLF